jgi:hypothetical protein
MLQIVQTVTAQLPYADLGQSTLGYHIPIKPMTGPWIGWC